MLTDVWENLTHGKNSERWNGVRLTAQPDNHAAAKDAVVNDTTVGHTSATPPASCANRQKTDTKTPQYLWSRPCVLWSWFYEVNLWVLLTGWIRIAYIQVALFFAPIRERIAFSLREAMVRSTVHLLNAVLVAMAAIEICGFSWIVFITAISFRGRCVVKDNGVFKTSFWRLVPFETSSFIYHAGPLRSPIYQVCGYGLSHDIGLFSCKETKFSGDNVNKH